MLWERRIASNGCVNIKGGSVRGMSSRHLAGLGRAAFSSCCAAGSSEAAAGKSWHGWRGRQAKSARGSAARHGGSSSGVAGAAAAGRKAAWLAARWRAGRLLSCCLIMQVRKSTMLCCVVATYHPCEEYSCDIFFAPWQPVVCCGRASMTGCSVAWLAGMASWRRYLKAENKAGR